MHQYSSREVIPFALLTSWLLGCSNSSDEPSNDFLGSGNGGFSSISNTGGSTTQRTGTTGGSRESSSSSLGGRGTTVSTATLVGNGGTVVNAGGSGAGGTSQTRTGATIGGSNASGGSVVSSLSGGTASSTRSSGSASGGAARGGTSATIPASGAGGATAGGTRSSGSASGGAARGGTSATVPASGAGGATAGGAGGASLPQGGSAGLGLGGAVTGGASGACTPTFADPPTATPSIGAWVNESFASQLGDNVKNRKAWLIDSAMLGKGQINLCVRWGATTAPTAAVKTGLAPAVQKWFNDWFSQLRDYGCFPYPNITAKVTGWAVRAANTAWTSDLGSDVKVYTDVDGEGEPKCADTCSFFTNWTHKFPNCPGGDDFHHDYWLWLDDSISGGAAAVGGDWGLRMPVKNFVDAMGKSNLVIEHEMGHGFGFQDYYDWTGTKPTGGSLMIVGSTSSQTPTEADTWLLRRTWKEMKNLRGW